MAIATEVGDRVGEGEAYGDLGRAYQSQGDFGQAIECPVKTVGGQLYVRISAAVYNERSDYEALSWAGARAMLVRLVPMSDPITKRSPVPSMG